MGTRALGDRPWLTGGGSTGNGRPGPDRLSQLDLRAELLRDRFHEVCAAPASAAEGIEELVGLVCETMGFEPPLITASADVASADVAVSDAGAERLAWLGRSIVEDLCLLRRGSTEWELEAGVLCFPSRWRLADKLGRPMREVHGPVDGYDPVLADRVTSLLDRLGEQIVIRRNWFVHPNSDLFQPERPADGDPFVPTANVLERLFVRCERQTLRALPVSGRIVFAITTQQCSLGRFVADNDRRSRFVRYLDQAPTNDITHRGLDPAQAAAALAAIS